MGEAASIRPIWPLSVASDLMGHHFFLQVATVETIDEGEFCQGGFLEDPRLLAP